jgi:hypothetical protein
LSHAPSGSAWEKTALSTLLCVRGRCCATSSGAPGAPPS